MINKQRHHAADMEDAISLAIEGSTQLITEDKIETNWGEVITMLKQYVGVTAIASVKGVKGTVRVLGESYEYKWGKGYKRCYVNRVRSRSV